MCGCVREELVDAFAVGFFSLVKAMADNVFIRAFFSFSFLLTLQLFIHPCIQVIELDDLHRIKEMLIHALHYTGLS